MPSENLLTLTLYSSNSTLVVQPAEAVCNFSCISVIYQLFSCSVEMLHPVIFITIFLSLMRHLMKEAQ